MKSQEYNKLVEDLQNEGSFDDYYQYLLDYYGSETYGTIFQEMEYHNQQCSSSLNKEDFIQAAMVEDLYHKDIEKVYWIAEAEKEYTDKPLFIALDRFYRINPSLDDTKESIKKRVKDLEEIQEKG